MKQETTCQKRTSRGGRRLSLWLTVVVIGVSAATFTAHYTFSRYTHGVRTMVGTLAQEILTCQHLSAEVADCRLAQARWGGCPADERPSAASAWRESADRLRGLVAQVVSELPEGVDQASFCQLQRQVNRYCEQVADQLQLQQAKSASKIDLQELAAADGRLTEIASRVEGLLAAERAILNGQATALEHDAASHQHLINARGVGAILVCVFCAFWLRWRVYNRVAYLGQSLALPPAEARQRLERERGSDEIGCLAASLSGLLERIVEWQTESRGEGLTKSISSEGDELLAALGNESRRLLDKLSVRRSGKGSSPAEQAEQRAVAWFGGMLEDLNELSNANGTGDLSVCAPRDILDEAVALLALPEESKAIECKTDSVIRELQTDPMRLRRSLVNVLTAAAGSSKQSAPRVLIGPAGDDRARPAVCFAVTVPDHGRNCKCASLAKREQRPTGTPCLGTNLNVMLARRQVQSLGGTLELGLNEQGQVTYYLTVPQKATATAEQSSSQAASHGQKILFAEDGPENQRFISRILERNGIAVTLVSNGKEAVEQLLKEPDAFDLVLMDMSMPVMDGEEATRRLRAAGFKRPIVALTALQRRYDEQMCRAAGCDYFLTKPVDCQQLISLIGKLSPRAKATQVV